jgi:hypothetical protein
MQGITAQKGMTPFDRKLDITQNMVTEVLTAIVSKFMTIQNSNPFLAMEILFKFTSQSTISQALSNYNLDCKPINDYDLGYINQQQFQEPEESEADSKQD